MQDEGKPVNREAWRRLLARGGGEPPRATDERIRAQARRALIPRAGRWWLPASLAASLLLAVMIVQWQYEEIGAPALMTESDVATRTEPAEEAGAAPEPAPQAAADSAATVTPRSVAEAFPQQEVRRESPAAESPAAALERAPPPPLLQDGPAVSPPAREGEASEQRAPAAAPVPAGKAEAIAVTGSRIGMLQASGKERADARTPEEWYAEIEKLREEGRDEEAEAELKRLEEAHPGWLEKHLTEER
ncbi:MAG: hypothetical protein ACT4UQ_06250 [Gammaproteobacteria bacterium]